MSEPLTFNSEEEKLAAISAIAETPENLEQLQATQDAEVKKAEEADSETEDTPAIVPESEPVLPPETPETKAVEKDPETPPEVGKQFTIKPEDLPEGYDTPGKVFKTVLHQAEFIKKQNEQMEELRLKYESQPPAPVKSVQPTELPHNVDYDTQIKDIEAKLEKQYDDDPLSPECYKMQRQIVALESSKLRAEIAAAKDETVKVATSQFEQYRQSKEQEEIDKKTQQTLAKDYEEMDTIGKDKDYKEYALSKPAKEVEKDFVMLRDEVVKAYYGREPQSYAEINNALTMYANKSPDLMLKLQAMNIPTEYPKDVLTYIEHLKLLNVRDGTRYNENGEQVPYRTRWDPISKKDIPDRLSTLRDAIEHQRVNSGYYKKKVLSAYDKGTKDITNALGKRDTNELQSDEGGLGIDKLSVQQLIEERDKLPETAENLGKLMELNKQIEEYTTKTT